MVEKHSDQIKTLELQAAKKEEVDEMKKTMFKPLLEKQDQMDDRLKRIERGEVVTAGGRCGNGGGDEGDIAQGKSRILARIGKTQVLLPIYSQSCRKLI